MPRCAFEIQVEPAYLPEQSAPQQALFAFAYTITIRNVGEVTAQLIARHWLISDAHGALQEVKGLGVIGQQPLLEPGQAFRYTSGCQLRTDHGSMRGSYFFVTEDGDRLDVEIPSFVLDAGASERPRVLH